MLTVSKFGHVLSPLTAGHQGGDASQMVIYFGVDESY